MPQHSTTPTCCDAKNNHEHLPDGTVRVSMNRGFTMLVDEADWQQIKDRRWTARTGGRGTPKYYAYNNVTKTYLHTLLVQPSDGMLPDHINGDSLDNRRQNLREVTPSQNQWNRPKHGTSSSRFKGVSWRARDKRWRAAICVHGRSIWIGEFSDEEDAARAYDEAARTYHGEFAVTNLK